MALNALIGALRVKLGLDSAEFDTGLKAAQGKLGGFGKLAGLAGAAIAAGMGAAAVGIGAAVKSAIDAADQMDELAQKTGTAVKPLSQLAYAGKISGVELDTLATGLKKLNVGMLDLAKGGKGKAADALRDLGISATDSAGALKANDQVLLEVADRFAAMQDGAQKSALAIQLFGKSGAELIPLLNEGAAGINELKAEADALGVTLSSETAAAAGLFNENLDKLKAVSGGIANQMMAALVPALNDAASGLLQASKDTFTMKAVGDALAGTLKVLASAGIIGAAVFGALGKTVAGVASAMVLASRGDFAGALDALNQKALDLKAVSASVKAVWTNDGKAVLSSMKSSGEAVAVATDKGKSAAKEQAKALKEAEKAAREFDQTLKSTLQGLETDGERTLREAHTAMLVLREGLDKGKISADEYREAIARLFPVIVDTSDAQKAWNPQIEKSISAAKKFGPEVRGLTDDARDLADAFGKVNFALDDMIRSIKSGDFGSFLLNVQDLTKGIGSLLAQGPSGIASLGAMAANAIGGKGGRAVGGGLGFAATGLGAGAFAASGAGATALGTLGLSVGAIGSIAALAGPIGLAAGALYAAAKIFNIGGKPSNKGAGYDLVTGQISGKSRDAETEGAVRAAGDAIVGLEAAFKEAGITLTDGVKGLVLGTRDQTQIYLESGKTLRSAVGDSGAAVETAMRELLATATYASEAQEKVAKAALAAGKSFEEVLAVLDAFDSAQGILSGIGDQILQIIDPKAFELKGVKAEIDAQREAAKAAKDAGYITAETLAAINTELSRLEALKIGKVLEQYGQTVESAAEVQGDYADRIADAEGRVADARQSLLDGIEDEIAAHEAVRDRLLDVADSLADFRRELATSALGGLDPRQQLAAAQRAFDAVAGKTDADSLARLPELGRALIAAQRAVAPNAQVLAATTNQVRAAVIAGEASARGQASAAQAQIDALTGNAQALGLLNQNIVTLAAREDALAQAIIFQAGVMAEASAAIAAAQSQLQSAVAAAAQAANASAAEMAAASRSAAALAGPTGGGAGASDPGVSVLVEKLDQVLAATIQGAVNTGRMERSLDDVINGQATLNTVAA